MANDPVKAAASRVVLVSGDEDALRRRAVAEVLEAAGSGPDDFDAASFAADERGPGEWVAAAGTVPFLAERRVVVVRNLLRQSLPSDLTDAGVEKLPDSALLLLVVDEEPGDDGKQRRLATVRQAWEKAVKAWGGAVIICESKPRQAAAQLREEAKRLHKKVSPRAADTLAEMVGGSLSRGIEELEKLAVYVGEAEEIREQDVLAVVRPAREWNVFRMLDAAIAGQGKDALHHLRVLLTGEGRPEEAAYRSVFPNLSRELSLLWQARARIDGHSADSQLRRPRLEDQADWKQTRLAAVARTLSPAQIRAMARELADADARLKGLLPAFSAEETLERLLLALIAIARPAATARRT